jgi:hypothetical protein
VRRWWWVAIACALLLAVLPLYLRCMGYYPIGWYNDDACYLLQARNFVAHGYVLSAGVDRDGATVSHLPGFPLMLAPLVALLPGDIRALRLAGIATSLLAVLLFTVFFWRPRDGKHRVAAQPDDADDPTAPTQALFYLAALLFTPCVMLNASTLMSDVACMLLMAGALFGVEQLSRDRAPRAFILGLYFGFLTAVRLAMVSCLVLAVWLAGQRRRGEAALLALGMALSAFPFVALSHMATTYAGSALNDYGSVRGFAWRVLEVFDRALRITGTDYIGVSGPSFLVLLAGAAMWLLALVGAVRERHGARNWIALLLGAQGSIYLLWPFLSARMLLSLWPLLLWLAVRAVRGRGALALLALITLCGACRVPGLLRESAESLASRETTYGAYQWLATHAPPEALLSCPLSFQAALLTSRRCVDQPAASVFDEFMAEVCARRIDFLVVQEKQGFDPPIPEPPHLLAWLQASTLVREEYAGNGLHVFRRLVAPGAFVHAYDRFVAAAQAAQAGGSAVNARKLLDMALGAVPDLPQARSLGAWLNLRAGEGAAATREYAALARQYPFAYDDAHRATVLYLEAGQAEAARQVAERSLQAARALGDADAAATFTRLLSAAAAPQTTAPRPAAPPRS